eukprot:11314402-Prorocentrum_lima.AAC.1
MKRVGAFNRESFLRQLARKRLRIIYEQADKQVETSRQARVLKESNRELTDLYVQQLHRVIDRDTEIKRLRQIVAQYREAYPGPMVWPPARRSRSASEPSTNPYAEAG